MEKQPVREMDRTKPFDTQTGAPEVDNTIPVFPYKCPTCGHMEFELVQSPVGTPVGFGEWPLLEEDLIAQAKERMSEK
jgi:hypothetical protein